MKKISIEDTIELLGKLVVVADAAAQVLPDLKRYAGKSGPGPDKRLDALVKALSDVSELEDKFK